MIKKLKGNHSVSSLAYHIVWCTKFRHPVLTPGVDVVVRHTIGQACGEYDWTLKSIEVVPDHVHVFVQANHTDSPEYIARTFKSMSAIAVLSTYPKLKGQKLWGTGLWSRGTHYGSVGNVSHETIKKYIENQKKKGIDPQD